MSIYSGNKFLHPDLSTGSSWLAALQKKQHLACSSLSWLTQKGRPQQQVRPHHMESILILHTLQQQITRMKLSTITCSDPSWHYCTPSPLTLKTLKMTLNMTHSKPHRQTTNELQHNQTHTIHRQTYTHTMPHHAHTSLSNDHLVVAHRCPSAQWAQPVWFCTMLHTYIELNTM